MKQRLRYILGIFFLLFSATCLGSLAPTLRYLTIGLVSLGGVSWLVQRVRTSRPWRLSKLLLLFGGYFIWQAALLLKTPLPQYSLDKVMGSLLLLLGFIFFVDYFDRLGKVWAWENALISFAIVFSVLEMLLVFFWYWNWWHRSGLGFSQPPIGYRLSGLFLGHPNIMAGFINLVLPIALIRLIVAKRKSRRVLWSGVLFLFVLVEYYSSSRGGWISAFVGLSITLILAYAPSLLSSWQQRKWKEEFSLSRRGRLILAGGIGLFFGMIFLFVRNVQMTPGHGGRWGLWVNAWNVWMRSPLLGSGVGSYPLLNAIETQLPPGFATAHAHNLWLQIGAETGVVGLLIVAAILWVCAKSWYRAWRAREISHQQRRSLAAYAGAGTAVFVHGLIDYLFDPPLYATSVLLILSFIIFYDKDHLFIYLPKGKTVMVIVLTLGVLITGSLYNLREAQPYWKGVNAGRAGDWRTAQAHICEAAEKNPSMSIYHFQCALASAYLYQESGDAALLEFAETSLDRGLAIDPYWPVHVANLAIVKWGQGNQTEAVTYMRQAVDAAPRNALFALNLGWMEEQLGNVREAGEAYLQAASSDAWVRHDLLLLPQAGGWDSFEEIRERKFPAAIRGYDALRTGELSKASEVLNAAIESNPVNEEAHTLRGILYQRQGEPALAWAEIQTALLLDASPKVLVWAAQVALEQNKEDEAITYLEQAYEKLRYSNEYSERYYYGVYHRYFLPIDLVPGYRRGDIIVDMADGFEWLAEQYNRNGMKEEADELLLWLRILSPDGLSFDLVPGFLHLEADVGQYEALSKLQAWYLAEGKSEKADQIGEYLEMVSTQWNQ